MNQERMSEELVAALAAKGWTPNRVLTWGRVVKADPAFMTLERDGEKWVEWSPFVQIQAAGQAAIVRR